MKRSRARTAASTIFVLITLPICAQVNVTTYHNDNLRTGQNTNETTLDDVFVAGSSFARIFQASVDGQIYGQPLVLSNLSIGGGSHNVVYVATENDSVYAFDAATGFQYWKTSLGSPLPSNETGGGSSCTDIKGPSYGITATPVIDTSVSPPLIYVVAQNGTEYQLNALSAETGLSAAGAVTITGTYSGASFDAINQLIRPALLLENGHVIFAAGSHCDLATWYGWVFSYNSITPKTPSFAQQAIFNTQPTGNSGGIWMSGGGVASDSSGYVYFSTGNSPDYVPPDYDNAMVKLNPVPASPSQQWTVADYFMPSASDLRGSEDHDVGSGGVLLIPNASQLVGMGKTGVLYLVNTTTGKMGKFCSSCNGNDTNIIQEIDNASHGVWGSPAFWNNNLYYGSSTGPVARFSYNVNGSGKLSTSPTTVTQQSFAGPPRRPSPPTAQTTACCGFWTMTVGVRVVVRCCTPMMRPSWSTPSSPAATSPAIRLGALSSLLSRQSRMGKCTLEDSRSLQPLARWSLAGPSQRVCPPAPVARTRVLSITSRSRLISSVAPIPGSGPPA